MSSMSVPLHCDHPDVFRNVCAILHSISINVVSSVDNLGLDPTDSEVIPICNIKAKKPSLVHIRALSPKGDTTLEFEQKITDIIHSLVPVTSMPSDIIRPQYFLHSIVMHTVFALQHFDLEADDSRVLQACVFGPSYISMYDNNQLNNNYTTQSRWMHSQLRISLDKFVNSNAVRVVSRVQHNAGPNKTNSDIINQQDAVLDIKTSTNNFHAPNNTIVEIEYQYDDHNTTSPNNNLDEEVVETDFTQHSGNWFNTKTDFEEKDTKASVFAWGLIVCLVYLPLLWFSTIICQTIYWLYKTTSAIYRLRMQMYQMKRHFGKSPSQIMELMQRMNSQQRMCLVEIKALIHTLYYVYLGRHADAAGHLSYTLLTRPLSLETLLANGGLAAYSYVAQTKYSLFQCYGKKIPVTNTEYERLCALSDSGVVIKPSDVNESIEVQSGNMEDVAANIGSLFAQWKVSDMAIKDIELANKQFAYMKNVSQDAAGKTGLMIMILRLVLRTGWSCDPLDAEYQMFSNDVIDCGEEIKSMVNKSNIVCSDRKYMLDVIALQKKAAGLLLHARMQSTSGSLQRYFASRFKEIDKLSTIAHQYLLGAQQRIEPVMVFIRGEPGSGKSLLTQAAMTAIEELDGSEFSPEKCYTIGKDRFFEGYNNQKFCNFDDVFQIENRLLYQDESEKIIRMNNSTPYNLPMAYEGKGITWFNSAYVILTSNYGKNTAWNKVDWTPLGLADHKAVTRRLDLVLERNAKSLEDLRMNTYLVCACDIFPDQVGRLLKTGEAIILMHKMQKYKAARLSRVKFSRNEIREMVGLEPTIDKEIELIPSKVSIATPVIDSSFSSMRKQLMETFGPLLSKEETPKVAEKFEIVQEDSILKQYNKLMAQQSAETKMPALSTDGLIHDDEDMILQNGEAPKLRRPPTTSEWMLKITSIELCEWHSSPYFKWFAYAAILLIAIITTKKVYDYFFGSLSEQSWSDKQPSVQGWEKQKNYKARTVKMHPSENFGYSTVPQVALHSGTNQTMITQSSFVDFHRSMTSTISRGVALMDVTAFDGVKKFSEFAIGFHIRDGLIITPAHFLLKFTADDMMQVKICMRIDGKIYDFDIPKETWKLEGEDVLLFYLPKQIPRPVALYKYLIQSKKMSTVHPLQELYQLGVGFQGETLIRNYTRVPKSGRVCYKVEGEVIIMRLGVTYTGDCQKGYSGSPTLVITPDGPKILGMHVGQTNQDNLGVSTVVCQEWFDNLTESMTTQSSDRALPVKIWKIVDSSMANNLPVRTRIRKSPIHGWNGPPDCIPARFTPFENDQGEIVDPLIVAMGKLKQEHFVSDEIVPEEQCLEFMLNTYPPNKDARLFTYDEALNGVPERGIPSIVGSTSAGYPYCLSALKGKNPYVVQVDNRYVYQTKFLQEVMSMEMQLIQGNQISVIWADTLKDETRPREKVMKGKTRLFTSCPLHYLVLMRRYTLDLVAQVQKLAATHPVSVGINPHSLQWTLLYHRMAELDGSIIAGDFSNYDGSVPAFLGKIVLKFVNTWYSANDIDSKVRALLFEHLWNGLRICGTSMYYTKDGNPSGNPITSMYNSWVNMLMCYIILTQDFKMLEDEFRMAMYGDDNIISTVRPGLRCSDFSPHFLRRFGMTYTHFTKVDGHDPLDTMDTIRYLGRKFTRNATVIRAPLELQTILESTYWVRGSDEQFTAFISTIRAAMLELSHFPLHEFNHQVDRIIDSVRLAGLLPQYEYLQIVRRTWYDYHTAFYDSSRNQTKQFLEVVAFAQETTQQSCHTLECQSGTAENYNSVKTGRNVEFTERAANDAPSAEDVQLGGYHDVAPTTKALVNNQIIQNPHKECNMETFDLDHTLTREYQMGSLTWSTSQGQDTVLGTYEYPRDLFNQQYLTQKIDNFRFFRAGIRFSIRVVSTKFLYGAIIVAYRPQANTSEYTPTSVTQWGGLPHVIVSASSGDTVIFDIPFVYPDRAIDLLETYADQMGRFEIVVISPLVDINGDPTSARVLVTAQFLEAELFMPHADVDVSSFEVQSGKGKEGRIKSEKDSTSSVYNITKALGSAIISTAISTSYGSNLLGTAKTVTNMIGLSKPRSTAMATVLKVNPFSDLNTGMGVDLTATLGMDPENQISTTPNVAGMDVDEMDFKQLCGTPTLVSTHTISVTTESLSIVSCDFVKGTFGNGANYAEWLANMFTYVSGSKKVKLYFIASQFHSVRLVLYLSDAPTADQWQDCYHRIVDIQGDTEVEFTLPYARSLLATSTNGSGNAFVLYATVLSWSQPNATIDTPIRVLIYTAASDDLMFGGLVDTGFTKQSCPRQEFAKDFEPFHASFTGFSTQNLLYGEKYTSVRHIIHRYNALGAAGNMQVAGVVDQYAGTGDTSNGKYMGLEQLGLIYKFWRGSKRVKFITKQQTPQSVVVYNENNVVLRGTAMSSVANPSVDIDLPYYQNHLYRSTYANTLTRAVIDTTQTSFVLTAAGDDFSFHFICPPPPGTFSFVPALYGFQALQFWTV